MRPSNKLRKELAKNTLLVIETIIDQLIDENERLWSSLEDDEEAEEGIEGEDEGLSKAKTYYIIKCLPAKIKPGTKSKKSPVLYYCGSEGDLLKIKDNDMDWSDDPDEEPTEFASWNHANLVVDLLQAPKGYNHPEIDEA